MPFLENFTFSLPRSEAANTRMNRCSENIVPNCVAFSWWKDRINFSLCLSSHGVSRDTKQTPSSPHKRTHTHTNACWDWTSAQYSKPLLSPLSPPLAQWTGHKAGCVHRLMGRTWLHQCNNFHTHTFTQRPNMCPPAWTYGQSLHLLSMHAHVFTL